MFHNGLLLFGNLHSFPLLETTPLLPAVQLPLNCFCDRSWHPNFDNFIHTGFLDLSQRDLGNASWDSALRLGPRPSIPSSCEEKEFLERNWRWKVMAKRWTSSWMRCKRKNSWELRDNSTTSSGSRRAAHGFGACRSFEAQQLEYPSPAPLGWLA